MSQTVKIKCTKIFVMNNNYLWSEMNRENFLTRAFIAQNFGMRKYSNYSKTNCVQWEKNVQIDMWTSW